MRSRYTKVKINGRTLLAHRHAWEQAHGPIPAGYVVHHRDEDRFNNDLANLELLTHQEHSAHHNQKYPLTKQCEVCGVTFTPEPTKRSRAKTCSWECRNRLLSQQKRMARLLAEANRP